MANEKKSKGVTANMSISKKDLTPRDRMEVFVNAYVKYEATKAAFIALGNNEEIVNKIIEHQSTKDKLKSQIDKYSKELEISIVSKEVETLDSLFEEIESFNNLSDL